MFYFPALHIHVSSEMQSALEELDAGFMTLERGMIQVKVSCHFFLIEMKIKMSCLSSPEKHVRSLVDHFFSDEVNTKSPNCCVLMTFFYHYLNA
jgi:hypothetical protein